MDFLHDTNVWVLMSFTIFVILAYVKGKDVILSLLDQKISTIKKEIEAAENMRVEAQELLAQYQRRNREAEKQAKEIISSAEKRVEELKKEAQKNISDDMKRREDQLQQRLELMEERALNGIKEHASRLTLAATRQIIANAITQKDNDRLNAEIISELSSKTVH